MTGVLKTITEPKGAGHWISGPYDPNQSAEEITLAATAVALPSGTMLGMVAIGTLSAVAAAPVSGTGAAPGNGTLNAVTVDAGAPTGEWQVKFTDATHFEVIRPDGTIEGNGTLGVPYNGGINFNGSAGGTAFTEDDRISVAVSAAAATKQFKPIDPAATDGSQNWAATLYEGRPAKPGGTQAAVGVVRGPVVGNLNLVSFLVSMTTDQKATAVAQAKAAGVIIRK
jgi:hypothetical protein